MPPAAPDLGWRRMRGGCVERRAHCSMLTLGPLPVGLRPTNQVLAKMHKDKPAREGANFALPKAGLNSSGDARIKSAAVLTFSSIGREDRGFPMCWQRFNR